MMYKFRDFFIPGYMMVGLKLYIEEGILPGKFLQAVIVNNLQLAVGMADDINIKNLPAYIGYLYNEAPSSCWGSKEKMEKWIKEKEKNNSSVKEREAVNA